MDTRRHPVFGLGGKKKEKPALMKVEIAVGLFLMDMDMDVVLKWR